MHHKLLNHGRCLGAPLTRRIYMQRAHTQSITPVARTAGTTFVAGLALLLMAGAGLAQNNLRPGTAAGGNSAGRLDAPSPGAPGRIPEAPVGHRQPRPQDLPPSVLREEGGGNRGGVNADRQLDQELQICKGC
jgi:hypothetical protein